MIRTSEGLLNFIFIVSIIGIEFNAVLGYGIVSWPVPGVQIVGSGAK